jgi:hypothetical protein
MEIVCEIPDENHVMTNQKRNIFMNEYNEFIDCISSDSWYSRGIDDFDDIFDKSSQFDDTIEFMDTLIEMFEAQTPSSELIIIQALFWLGDEQKIDFNIPTIYESKQQLKSASICAFKHKIAALTKRIESYRRAIWCELPKYSSEKIFTYYQCDRYPDDKMGGDKIIPRYCRGIIRLYSQKGIAGNSPINLVP